ncbi:MAG: ribonuclease III family protein [Candidatus Kariarchaeaceae archaeon]|jgi:hypothetical protein
MVDIQKLPSLSGILSTRSLRAILESKDLAQLGDFLTNFIYTSVRIGVKGATGSIHVWDGSLRDAMEQSSLRGKLGKKARPGRVADAAEAIIAYCYLHKLVSLDEMVEFLAQRLNAEDFEVRRMEKLACGTAFGELLGLLVIRLKESNQLDFDA